MPSHSPPRLTPGHRANFTTLQQASDNGDLALVSARRASDGAPVALVCALRREQDGAISPVPLAVMVEGNPYELFEDPTRA